MAAELDIIIEQGSTFSRTVTLKNDDNSPIDLTGFLVRAQVRKTPQDPVAESFTVAMPAPATGVFSLTLSATQTATLATVGPSWNRYTGMVWDCEIESAQGIVTRILNGAANVSPEVTR